VDVRERQGRTVTSKVLAILDAFSPSAEALTLNELSGRAGLPLSTAYRLASELVEWGGLERVDGGGYRVGLRLWEVGALASRGATLVEVARPFMHDLYEATRENVHLAILDGYEVLYVEKMSGRGAVPLKSRLGGRLPLHATGAGKVLLAFAPDAFVEEVVAAGLHRYTPHTIVTPGALQRALAEVRRTGLGITREELTLGSVSVASPVFVGTGEVPAALSLVLRSSRADLQRLAPAVRTAALGASRDFEAHQARPAGSAAGPWDDPARTTSRPPRI
jgi:DNA-binding IclR family transcriptional regulator